MQTNQTEKKVLLRISHLKQWFPVKKTTIGGEQLYVRANDDISLDIYEGETLGLVGESGCGKSTLGRVLLQLYHQTEGKTMYYGRTIDSLAPAYVEKTLKHLESGRAKLRELEAKRDKLVREYESLDETSRRAKKAEKDKAVKEAHSLFLDMAQLVGGFLALDDLKPVSELFLQEYRSAAALHKMREARDLVQIDRNAVEGRRDAAKQKGKNAASLEAKLRKLDADLKARDEKIAAGEAELAKIRTEIESLRIQNAGKGKFDEYERYRDDGIDLAKLGYKEMRQLRKDLQLIFQDPYSSLNPRMTVGQIIGEGLLAHNFFQKNDDRMMDYVMQVMENCGLSSYMIHRYPHQFSGGQRQRIGIARSLAVKPKFVVCDEAVSALDVSIQSQVINLLQDLKEQEHLTYLFITHDLSVVKYISDRIAVMYLGNVVELARSEDLFAHPLHPYTEALLLAIPTTDLDHRKQIVPLEGDIPSPIKPPKGCKFHTRCKYATDLCREVVPDFVEAEPGHFVACHHILDHKVIE
ncbi:MAG TPA: ATP-binding cassette domain-containing protein [Candidatus Merdivicinus faecavium]|nr:ATP-binding cassette domain-containing protein [Candidatus Merdivicinus faecavium]